MPQDDCVLKRGATANARDLAKYAVRWTKFSGLSDAFGEKQRVIFNGRFLQNLDLANLGSLLGLF